MSAILGSVGVGFLCGLLVYAFVRLVFDGIPVENFINVIGLAAVVGAGIAAVVARRRAAGASKRGHDANKK